MRLKNTLLLWVRRFLWPVVAVALAIVIIRAPGFTGPDYSEDKGLESGIEASSLEGRPISGVVEQPSVETQAGPPWE